MISQKQINEWIPVALAHFKSVMPPVDAPDPIIRIGSPDTLRKVRNELLELTGSKSINMKEPYDTVMETLAGDKGTAILINQKYVNQNCFLHEFWHELGHYYSTLFEPPQFALLDGLEVLSDRERQEGFWMWREFIAESISCYVEGKLWKYNEDFKKEHHWNKIEDNLRYMLHQAFETYPYTVDEYALAYYFAVLLMDASTQAYMDDADENTLLLWDPKKYDYVLMKPESIEPTQISTVPKCYHKILLNMKELLEDQLDKDEFWITDSDFLYQLGQMIFALNTVKADQILSSTSHPVFRSFQRNPI